jgi:hypothetical protein
MKVFYKIIFILIGCLPLSISAQEYIKAPGGNLNLYYSAPTKPIKNTSSQKVSASTSDTIPFFEDFYYAPNSPYPTGNHWVDSSVYVNTGFAIAPPSIGVATFDGLDKNGYPYDIAATTVVSQPADYLTSRPINLFTNPLSTYTYSPVDSVGISFLYQAQGFGENPASNDSLVLEFYKPLDSVPSTTLHGTWNRVWSVRGNNSPPVNDTIFKKAFVRIKDTAYFHDGFKMRFRNRATGAGNADHWHIDYIRLKTNLYKTDTTYDDVTIGYMPRPILKNYSSMPYYQYTASEMGTKFSNFIRNNNVGVVKNSNYEYSLYSSSMALLSSYGTGSGNNGNVNPFVTRGWDSIATHRNPPLSYTINPLTDSTSFIIKHIVSASPDIWHYNDTVVQRLSFNNYYAYDDGSAESVYYHNVYGAKDAIKYTLNVTDTLRALDIFFDPFIDGNTIKNSQFRMYVWSDGGTTGPGFVLRRDSAMKPVYLDFGYNQIPRYFFTSPMILSAGTYYIGMMQVTNQPLYVGFDRNYDHHTKLYYDVGFGWNPSGITGSLMIHPVFGEATRAYVGIKEETSKPKESFITVYPNPANDKLYISAEKLNTNDHYTLELHSVLGTKLVDTFIENTITEIDLNSYSTGIYFVVLKENNSPVTTKKFIISR